MVNVLSSSDWIAIVSLITSTFLAIILYQRIRKKKLILLLHSHFKMNNVDFSNYSELQMVFKNEELSKYLFFYSGTIIMIGDEDIEEDEIKYPISLITTDKTGEWKHYKVIDKTSLFNCNLEIEHKTLKFNTKEIKNKDFVKFNAYYNANTLGAKFHHRIINVNNVEQIEEREAPIYKFCIVFFSIVLPFLAGSIIADFFPSNKNDMSNKRLNYKLEPEYTAISNFEPLNKKDSLRANRNSYNDLYIVNGEKLESDSLFVINRKLNNRKNAARKKVEYEKIDNAFKNKTSEHDKFKMDLEKKSVKNRDSLYFENDYSLSDKTDTIIYSLLKKKLKINNKTKYKINDTISVSFIKRTDQFSKQVDNLYLIIKIILFLLMIVINIILIFKVYLLYKYRKVLID